MNIMDIAIDPEKAKKGVKVFYDKEKTCGAVVTQYMSASHRASLAKHKARYQKELDIYEKKGDKDNIERISRRILAHSMAETVIVEIFGFQFPDESGELVEVESSNEVIFNLLTMPEFEAFYAWIIQASNNTETFGASEGAWEEIGKKLQETSSIK